jgi:ABC-2 type transport system permease protein
VTALASAARVPWAFFRRDRLIATSYKGGVILGIGASVATVLIFFFISQTFGSVARGMDLYGNSYFAFVIVGVAVTQFLGISLGGVGAALRESQTTGTLELMLLSPSRLWVILLSSTLWLQWSAIMGGIAYFAIAVLLGVDFSHANLPATILGLALTIVAFTGLGLFAGSAVLLIKRGNPVSWAIRGASIVLSGVFYPIDVLPPPLQALGQILPMTHALHVLRGSVLLGQGIAELAGSLAILAVLSVLCLALGLAACAASIRFGRIDGSLGQY